MDNSSPMDVLQNLSPGLNQGQMGDIVQQIINNDMQNSNWKQQGADIVQNQADQGANIVAGMNPVSVQGQGSGGANNPSEFMQDIAAITGIGQAPVMGGGLSGGGEDKTMDLYRMRSDARTQKANQINSMIQARGQTAAGLLNEQTQAATGMLGKQMDTQTAQLGYKADLYKTQVQIGVQMSSILMQRIQMGDAAAKSLFEEAAKIVPANTEDYARLIGEAGKEEAMVIEKYGYAALTQAVEHQNVIRAAKRLNLVPQDAAKEATSATPMGAAPLTPGQAPATSSLGQNMITGATGPQAPAAPITITPQTGSEAITQSVGAPTGGYSDIGQSLRAQAAAIDTQIAQVRANGQMTEADKTAKVDSLMTQKRDITSQLTSLVAAPTKLRREQAAATTEEVGAAQTVSGAKMTREGLLPQRANVEDSLKALEDLKGDFLAKPGIAIDERMKLLALKAQGGDQIAAHKLAELQLLNSTLTEAPIVLKGALIPGGGGATDAARESLSHIAGSIGDNYAQIKGNLLQMKQLMAEKGLANQGLPGGPVTEAEFQKYYAIKSRLGPGGALAQPVQIPDGAVKKDNQGNVWTMQNGKKVLTGPAGTTAPQTYQDRVNAIPK